jgi:hypothetical protein
MEEHGIAARYTLLIYCFWNAWYLGAEPSQPSNLFTAQQGFRLGALWNLFPDATSLLSVFFTV